MKSNPLALTLCGVEMQNPVIAASGTFGFGHEYADIMDVSRLGGISGKGLTLNGSAGNIGMRVYETPAGMLNSIGLENPGVTHFVEHEAAYMRALGPAVLCNLGGHSEEDYLEGARLLNEADIDFLELNISCPNVKAGGMAFGMQPETAADITKKSPGGLAPSADGQALAKRAGSGRCRARLSGRGRGCFKPREHIPRHGDRRKAEARGV